MRFYNETGRLDLLAIDEAANELALKYLELYPDGRPRTAAEFIKEFFRVKEEIEAEIKHQS